MIQLIEDSGLSTESKLAMLERRLKVGELETPKEYVEPIGNAEYPKSEYMRAIAEKYYGPYSWIIISSNEIYNNGILIAEKVHGRLTWKEEGTIFSGDMIAAHQIQYTKDDKTKLSDIGNDIKSANTDCWKKALNFHLHICNDIYRWQNPFLSNNHSLVLEYKKYLENLGDRKLMDKYLDYFNVPMKITAKSISRYIQELKLITNRKG